MATQSEHTSLTINRVTIQILVTRMDIPSFQTHMEIPILTTTTLLVGLTLTDRVEVLRDVNHHRHVLVVSAHCC